MDARNFVLESIKSLNEDKSQDAWRPFDHYIMNLPASAVDFLGRMRSLCADSDLYRRL